MGKHVVQKKVQQSPSGFRKYVKTPKGYVTILLIALAIIGAFHLSDVRGLANVCLAVATAVVVDGIVAIMQHRQKFLSDGGIVTALIIALVLVTSAPWYVVVATTAIGIISKHVLKSGRKPLFNPAAVGLLIAIYVFHVGESWWGDLSALPQIFLLCVIVAGYLITQRVNKFPQVFSFLAVSFVIFGIAGMLHDSLAADSFRNPIINSTLFLAFFMMTDPPTSPAKYSEQIRFGIITALVSCVVYLVFGGLTYDLIGLLVANAWKAWKSRKGNEVRQAKTKSSGEAEVSQKTVRVSRREFEM